MGVLDKIIGGDYEARSATRQAQETMDILKEQYPGLMDMLNQGNLTSARGDLAAAQAVTPGYNDLAVGEMTRLAPSLTQIQYTLDSGQAKSDIARLNQYGAQAGTALRDTDASANKEFYSNLDKTGAKYSQLLDSLSPNMSAGRRAEVERGVGRMGGPDNSAVTTAEKAMQFGSAHDEHMSNFSNVLNNVSSGLQNLRTGLNPANIALGRDSRSAPALGVVNPVTKPGNTGTQVGMNMYNQSLGSVMNHDNTNAQKQQGWGDAIGNTINTIGKFAKIGGGW